jgi:hypothetical protein
MQFQQPKRTRCPRDRRWEAITDEAADEERFAWMRKKYSLVELSHPRYKGVKPQLRYGTHGWERACKMMLVRFDDKGEEVPYRWRPLLESLVRDRFRVLGAHLITSRRDRALAFYVYMEDQVMVSLWSSFDMFLPWKLMVAEYNADCPDNYLWEKVVARGDGMSDQPGGAAAASAGVQSKDDSGEPVDSWEEDLYEGLEDEEEVGDEGVHDDVAAAVAALEAAVAAEAAAQGIGGV